MDDKKLAILEAIKRGEKIDFRDRFKISLQDLLTKDSNNITYLEYACKNGYSFTTSNQEEIYNNVQILYMCLKNNCFPQWMLNKDEDIFFEKVEGDKKLIDLIFEKKLYIGALFLSSFENRIEIIDYIIKYKSHDLYYVSDELTAKLFRKQNGIYPIDNYINNFDVIKMLVPKAPSNLLINYCRLRNNYEILKYCKEEVLLYKLENGKTIIETLLDKGIDPKSNGNYYKSQDILNILIKYNRIDLFYNVDIETLLTKYNQDKTYLDLMIDICKKEKDVNLEKISYDYSSYPSEITALELIKLAQNNLVGFVPKITKEMLLYKGKEDKKSVLECLVEMDKELTLSQILNKCREADDPHFAIIIKNLGIDTSRIKFKSNETRLQDLYIEQYNKDYSKDCISVCPELLDNLKQLFYNDNISDKKAIDALIISYEYLTSLNNPNYQMFIIELRQLIEIKKQNMKKFTYTKIDDGAFFNRDKGILLDNDVISTINHETSHALHYYLSGDFIPEDYDDVITRVINNPLSISKINEYSKKYIELRENVKSQISKSKINEYYENLYKDDKLLELANFLASSKEEQKKHFKNDYNEQVLDTILAKTYSVDEFINQRKEIESFEILDATMRNDNDAFIAIGDIIDAIYFGKFRNGVLFDNNREIIDSAYGHGIYYYNTSKTNGFKEMIANYGSIIKSKNSDKILLYLRSIVGDEVVDMIKNVYENKILKSQTYIQSLDSEEMTHAR